MARVSNVSRSFTKGEIAPELLGQQGSDIYNISGQRFENFMPHPIGHKTSRPSFDYVATTDREPFATFKFNRPSGEGYLASIQNFGDGFTVVPYLIVYDKNGLVQYNLEVNDQPAINNFKRNGNEFFLSVDPSPGPVTLPFQIGDYLSLDIDIAGIQRRVGFLRVTDNQPVASQRVDITLALDTRFHQDLIDLPDNTQFFFDNLFVDEIQQASNYSFFTYDPETFTFNVGTIKSTIVGDTLYLCNSLNSELAKIQFDSDNALLPNTARQFLLSEVQPTGIATTYQPTAIGFYEQRLILASGNNLRFSQSANPEDFTTGTNDGDGMSYSIAGLNNNVANILWIQPNEKFLLVGTSTGNHVVRGSGEFDAITPTNITIRQIDSLGSSDIQPVNSDSRVYFSEKGEENLRGINFNFAVRGYSSIDFNSLAKHINKDKIKKIEFYQREPNRIFCLLESGIIATCIVGSEGQSFSWHRIKHADGDIIDIVTCFDGNSMDDLYVLVKRDIDGEEVFVYEKLDVDQYYKPIQDFFTGDKDADEAAYVKYILEKQKNDVRLDSRIMFKQNLGNLNTIFVSDQLDQSTTGYFRLGTNTTERFGRDAFQIIQEVQIGDEIRETNGPGVLTVTAKSIDYSATDYRLTGDITVPFQALIDEQTNVNPNANLYTFNVFSDNRFDEIYIKKNIFNAPHLAGKDVTVVIESRPFAKTVPSTGLLDVSDINTFTDSTNFNPENIVVYLGTGFRCIYKSNPLIGVAQLGASDYKKKNLSNVFMRVANSLGFKYGTNPYNLSEVIFRTSVDSFFDQVPYFTGVTEPLYIEDDSERDVCFYIVQDNPFPCNILTYGFDIKTEDL